MVIFPAILLQTLAHMGLLHHSMHAQPGQGQFPSARTQESKLRDAYQHCQHQKWRNWNFCLCSQPQNFQPYKIQLVRLHGVWTGSNQSRKATTWIKTWCLHRIVAVQCHCNSCFKGVLQGANVSTTICSLKLYAMTINIKEVNINFSTMDKVCTENIPLGPLASDGEGFQKDASLLEQRKNYLKTPENSKFCLWWICFKWLIINRNAVKILNVDVFKHLKVSTGLHFELHRRVYLSFWSQIIAFIVQKLQIIRFRSNFLISIPDCIACLGSMAFPVFADRKL